MVTLAAHYTIRPNLTYLVVGTWEGHVDLYLPEPRGAATPTLIWIHGGGWTQSSKEEELLYTLPYLERGWSVVNIEYRLARMAPAPAAVDDVRCAVAWVYREAGRYGLGTSTVVVSGISAGAHLALETAFQDTELPVTCPGPKPPPPAAIVSWFGPSDLEEVSSGPRAIDQVRPWFAGLADPAATARAISPIRQVRRGLPPVLVLHGTADDIVPYEQSVELHDALDRARVPNRLVALAGGHGDFSDATWVRAWRAVWQFLDSIPPSSA